jgi:spore germination protein YaaH
LADRARSDRVLDQIMAFVAANKLQGVTVDFEDIPPTAHKNLEDFLSRMSAAFASHDWIIAQAAPFDDDQWPYQTYSDIVDYTMLMAFDQVDDKGPAGSIAGQDWYEKTLDKRMRQLPADSTIITLGSWAYDWADKNPAWSSIRRATIRISIMAKATAPSMTSGSWMASPPSTRSMPPIPIARPAMLCGDWVPKTPASCP